MRETRVTVGGTEHVFRYGLKAMFLFEQLADKPFNLERLQDFFIFYFACFLAADPSFMDGDFGRFMEACEEDALLPSRLREALDSLSQAQSNVDNRESAQDAGGKKKV